MRRRDVERVRRAADGRWGDVLQRLAPALGQALELRPRHVPCPVHGGKDGFRLFSDAERTGGGICNTCGPRYDGFAMLQWVNGWQFTETLDAVASYLSLDWEEESDVDGEEQRRQRLATLWRATTVDTGRIRDYLLARGLSGLVPPTLRLHPALPYYTPTGRYLGTYPAMVAPLQSAAGEVVALHRTYLDPDADVKADVESPKKITPPVRAGATRGAAVRLGRVGNAINLTEGIETGLAVQERYGVTLAAATAGGMESFEPPDGVKRLTIYADNDLSGTGQRASAKARRRLTERGLRVSVEIPGEIGKDWLDILTRER